MYFVKVYHVLTDMLNYPERYCERWFVILAIKKSLARETQRSVQLDQNRCPTVFHYIAISCDSPFNILGQFRVCRLFPFMSNMDQPTRRKCVKNLRNQSQIILNLHSS